MATSYSMSDWIWVPDDVDVVLPAKVLQVFKAGEKGQVMVQRLLPSQGKGQPPQFEEEERELSAKETKNLERMDPNSTHSLEDMVNLRSLSENSILHNLRLRFMENQIYSSVGSILVSVNPFQELPLYTAEVLDSYRDNGFRNMPPHVFGVADMAYSTMTETSNDQSCIVSGESGAGKTEATKIFLQYIAEVSSQASKQSGETGKNATEKTTLQEQILKANPLMEAFGNAKTVRNNNSSRFGKWIEIKFNNRKGTIIGGEIVQYLLEKSRIVAQAPSERNYHIFYNLCAGAMMDTEVKRKFSVSDPREYNYLNSEEDVLYIPGMSDETDWENVLNSMQALGLSLKEQDDLFRTIAGILHLGNIEFADKAGTFAEDSEVVNKDMLALAATQIGVKPEDLEGALCTQKINTVRETTTKELNPNQAMDARDALAKALYANMFDWLIARINTSLSQEEPNNKTAKESISIIGVLDIFGFEVFESNSLEQLCINYCNEKLQYHFNNHIFKLEEAIYKAEGVDVSKIVFKDNIPTIQLFEAKGVGIFPTLDEVMFLPHGTDKKFLDTISKNQQKHASFKGPGVKTNYERNSFAVLHYAGEVRYNVDRFLEKNTDKVSDDINMLIGSSTVEFVANLIPAAGGTAAGGSRQGNRRGGGSKAGGKGGTKINNRKKGASLCTKFKKQLDILMETLNRTEPQFIRCIKPNEEKSGGIFTAQLVMEQLRYAGLLEVCRIRKLGYPLRREFKHFLFRYGCLVDDETATHRGAVNVQAVKSLCASLVGLELLQVGEFQIGKTKVFLRGDQVDLLEGKREGALKKYALKIQSVVRGWLERKKYKFFLSIIQELEAAVANRDVVAINAAIANYGELPFGGRHRKELAAAKKLIAEMEENNRVIKMLESAAEKRDMNVIKSALEASSGLTIVSNFKEQEIEDKVAHAKTILAELEKEQEAKEALKDAMKDRNLEKVTAALQTLSEMGLSDIKEYQQGEIMRAKLEESERILRNIEQAIEERHMERLQEALSSAAEMGNLSTDERVVRGKQVLEELVAALEAEMQEQIRAEEKKREEELRAKHELEIGQIKEELVQSIKDQDFSQVSELKTRAIELGMDRAELDSILVEVEAVEKMNEQVNSLNAAMEGLRTLMLNKNGISRQDMNYLGDIIDRARESGLTEQNNGVLQKAVELEEHARRQLEIQTALEDSINNKNFTELKNAINDADEMDLEVDLLTTARELLKEENFYKDPVFDNGNRMSMRVPDDPDSLAEDPELIEGIRRQRMIEEARHAKYTFSKFYNIRSTGDYARGIIFNKKRVIENQLRHQSTVIPKSILTLRKDLNKMAIGIHKSILGYCGELSMQFPASLAQDILEKGLTNPALVDEIYIQFCKQLTTNDRPESVSRIWQLMCMAVATFPPSSEFEFYLLNFLVLHMDNKALPGNYARYALRRLEGMLIRGTSGFVLTYDEILAFKKRPPVLSTIEMVDGSTITQDLPVPPDLNVGRVVEVCSHFLDLKDDRASLFGIYVQEEWDPEFDEYDLPQSGYSAMRANAEDLDFPPPPPLDNNTPEPLPETPHPLRADDFLGDVVIRTARTNKKYTLVFKKKLFVPGDEQLKEDPMYNRLMYMQAADEIIKGSVLVEKEKDLLYLTAIAMKIDIPDDIGFPRGEQQLLEHNLMSYIPFNWASKKTEVNWAQAIAMYRGKVIRKPNEDLEALYVKMVTDLPLWGYNFFFVRLDQEAKDSICAVGFAGLNFLTPGRRLTQSYSFDVLERWGGSAKSFWMLVWSDKEKVRKRVTFETTQARDISNLILDYTQLRRQKRGPK